jgi:alkanesulfonate monooxygenase SsuD/methylene tetrahydromethanopterin reductase-like flavin-dependent oxidoreductase (luciferase family)
MIDSSSTAPRFGIHTLQTTSWPSLRYRWKWLEELGFDSLWLPDHFFLKSGRHTPMFEAWTLLAGLALETQRVRIGTLVSSNTFRHPALLAKQAVTVDHLSNGRLELGIGTGWFKEEHEAFGIPFPDAGELVSRFEDSVRLLDNYLSNDETSLAGTFFQLDRVHNSPRSVQRPRPPLLMGAHRPRMLRLAARYADTWNSYGRPDELKHRNQALTEACEMIGRSPDAVRRSVFFSPLQSPDEQPWASTDAFQSYVGRHTEVGMQDFIFQLPESTAAKVVEQIAVDVLPHLKSTPQ